MVPVLFRVINKLVTCVLLSTDYIRKNIRVIFSSKTKLVSNNSTTVEIIVVRDRSEPVTATEQEDPYGLPTPTTEMMLTLQKQR